MSLFLGHAPGCPFFKKGHPGACPFLRGHAPGCPGHLGACFCKTLLKSLDSRPGFFRRIRPHTRRIRPSAPIRAVSAPRGADTAPYGGGTFAPHTLRMGADTARMRGGYAAYEGYGAYPPPYAAYEGRRGGYGAYPPPYAAYGAPSDSISDQFHNDQFGIRISDLH